MARLFDLVRVREERVRLAFYFALRDTLVADSLDQASRIAYGRDKRWGRVVTIKVPHPLPCPYLTSPYPTSPYLTLPQPTLPYLNLSYLTSLIALCPVPPSPYLPLFYLTMPCFTLLYFTLFHLASLCFTPYARIRVCTLTCST